MSTFDRYKPLKVNGKLGIMPFVEIKKKNTDIYIIYNKKQTQFDKLSYQYYGSPDFGWLIMQSNPEYGSIENFIPDGVSIRIPYPLEDTLNAYINDIVYYNENK